VRPGESGKKAGRTGSDDLVIAALCGALSYNRRGERGADDQYRDTLEIHRTSSSFESSRLNEAGMKRVGEGLGAFMNADQETRAIQAIRRNGKGGKTSEWRRVYHYDCRCQRKSKDETRIGGKHGSRSWADWDRAP